MKRLRLMLVVLSLLFAFSFTNLAVVGVRADGPQGQQDSKSNGPSAPSTAEIIVLIFVRLF